MSRFLLLAVFLASLSACAGTGDFEQPPAFDQWEMRSMAQTVVDDEFRISVAVPSREESRQIFGIDLSEKDIQAVWIKIENHSERPVMFLPTGLDPEYFAPNEVAFGFREGYSRAAEQELTLHTVRMSFADPILPGTAVSGFVYANRDIGTKVVTVDLLGRAWARSYSASQR